MVFALVIALAGSGCSAILPSAAMVVNGETVSRSQVYDYLANLKKSSAPAVGVLPDSTKYSTDDASTYLTSRVQILIVLQDAKARGVQPTSADQSSAKQQASQSALKDDPKFVDALASVDAIGRSLAVEAFSSGQVDKNDLMQKRYEIDKAQAAQQSPAQVCVHVIAYSGAPIDPATGQLTHKPTDAELATALSQITEAKSRLDAGVSFEEAAANSDLKDLVPKGDGGCGSASSLGQQFPGLLEQTDGVVGVPIKSSTGYYLFRVDRRTAGGEGPTFDQLKDQVESEVTADEGGKRFRGHLTQLLNDATISVDSRFGRWDRDKLSVVPPEGAAPSTTFSSRPPTSAKGTVPQGAAPAETPPEGSAPPGTAPAETSPTGSAPPQATPPSTPSGSSPAPSKG